MIVVDLFAGRDAKGALSSLAGLGLLGTAIPLITLAVSGTTAVDVRRRASWSTTSRSRSTPCS